MQSIPNYFFEYTSLKYVQFLPGEKTVPNSRLQLARVCKF
jgi:hypothetical protein